MRRLIIAAALVLPLLCAGEASAVTPGLNDTGPNGGVWGIMKRAADARRALDKAYATVVTPPDSALALSCFEKALALSSNLGTIFSDKPPPNIAPPNYLVFKKGTGVYNQYAGMGLKQNPLDPTDLPRPNTLADAYLVGMENTLDVYMGGNGGYNYSTDLGTSQPPPATPPDPDDRQEPDPPAPTMNYAGSISARMGATQMGALAAHANFIYTTLLSEVPELLLTFHASDPASTESQLLSAITAADGVLDQFETQGARWVLSTGEPGFYGALVPVYGDPAADPPVTGLRKDMYVQINGDDTTDPDNPVPGIREKFMHFHTGAFYPTSSMEGCLRIAKLWEGIPGNDLGVKGAVGGGPTAGVPFATVTSAAGGDVPGGNADFNAALVSSGPALSESRKDLVVMLRAPYGTPPTADQTDFYNAVSLVPTNAIDPPNSLDSWRPPLAPASVPANATTADIVTLLPPPP